MKLTARILALLATAMPLSAHSADTTDTAAPKFGAREDVAQMSISPDGKRVAFLRPTKGTGTAVFVADLIDGAAPKPILVSSGHPDRLTDCHWSAPTRLVCGIYIITDVGLGQLGYTRLMSLNADGSDLKELSARTSSRAGYSLQNGGEVIDWTGDGSDRSVLMTHAYSDEQTTGTLLANTREGLGVDLIDTVTLKRKVVESPHKSVDSYLTDGRGTVRVMGIMTTSDSGYLGSRITYRYRPQGSRDWQPLSLVTIGSAHDTGFRPVAIDHEQNVVYGFDDHEGHLALFKIALEGSMKRDLVLSQPDVDVDGLITIGRQDRVVGASFATDKRTALFFDPALKALSASLSKALPGLPIVSVIDASSDESHLLLFAGSDSDPGHYYVFDKGTHKLSELLPVRPELTGTKLASVKPISFKASDGTMIPAYLTLPPGSDGHNLPAIVMPHGGPASRDEWGFDWLSQYFANQGFAVIQPEFRGSTGYGEAWFQKNGFQSWRVAIGDVNDAGRYLLSSGIAAPGKLAIFGWSYGGYAALQSSVLDPALFKAIVAVAPVTDLTMLREEHRRFADFNLVNAQIGSGPHVTEGSPLQNAAKINAPVLIFHGTFDRNVGVDESRAMASRLKSAGKQVSYIEYKGLDHQLEDEAARTELLGRSSALFKKTFGM